MQKPRFLLARGCIDFAELAFPLTRIGCGTACTKVCHGCHHLRFDCSSNSALVPSMLASPQSRIDFSTGSSDLPFFVRRYASRPGCSTDGNCSIKSCSSNRAKRSLKICGNPKWLLAFGKCFP